MPHLNLNDRKVLCGHTIFLETIQILGRSYPRIEDEEFRNSVHALIVEGLKESKNDQPLDDAIGYVVKQLKEHFQTTFSDNHKLVAKFGENLDQQLEAVRCRACNNDKICDGNEINDEQIVIQRGLCIDTIKKVFDLASEVTKTYYQHFCSLCNDVLLPEIILSTAHSESRLNAHILPSKVCVSASINLNIALRTIAQVKLITIVDTFDLDSYLTIPYLMFHECVAHAFHALIPTSTDEVTIEDSDPFAEGFMAYVAYEVMREVLLKDSPTVPLYNRLLSPRKQFELGEQFHKARLNTEEGEDIQNAIHRLQGDSAAERMLQNFRFICPEEEEAWSLFLRLSFDLNIVSDLDFIQKYQVILFAKTKLLRKPLYEYNQSFPSRGAITILQSYRLHKDIYQLVREVEDFMPPPAY